MGARIFGLVVPGCNDGSTVLSLAASGN